jgi:hypothetical protein
VASWCLCADRFGGTYRPPSIVQELSAVTDDISNQLDDTLDPRDIIARDRLALEPARASLVEAGFYAYGMLDDQNRWTIAVDDEAGRVDVHVGDDGLDVALWVSTPGIYADEESEWRRKSRARLARFQLARINRGLLASNQVAIWDEVDEGISLSERYQLPFTRTTDIGAFAREHLPQLELLLESIGRQLD